MGQYLEWTVSEYIEHWQKILSDGGRVPQLYARILQLALRHESALHGAETPPVAPELRDLPVRDLLFYFREKSDSIAVNRLCSGTISTIADLMECNWNELKFIPYIGRSALARALRYKKWLAENWERMLADRREVNTPVTVPSDYDPGADPLAELRRALSECALIIAGRINNARYIHSPRDAAGMNFISRLLSLRYNGCFSFNVIAKELKRTPWHITKKHNDFVSTLTGGGTVNGNITLAPELCCRIADELQSSMFRHITGGRYSDPEDSSLLGTLGIAILETGEGTGLLIPSREKCRYTAKLRTVMRTLRESAVPLSRSKFERLLRASPEFAGGITETDVRFIRAVVEQPGYVEILENGDLKLRIEHLVSDEQRMARIIYDERRWMSRAEIFGRYRQIMGKASNSVNLSNLRKYGINSNGDLWSWGKKLLPIGQFVAQYAEERRCFSLGELTARLAADGYPVSARLRNYITTCCLVDNADPNHFCHKSHTAEFPQYNWRRPGRYGLANWIICCIRDICLESERPTISEIVEKVEKRAVSEGKAPYIRQRVRHILVSYCGADKPFLTDGSRVWLNPEIYPTVNFQVIGRRGHNKTEQFEQIRRFAVQTLLGADEERVPLVRFLKMLNEGRDKPVTRNSCLRALNNSYLTPIPVKTDVHEGAIVLRLSDEEKQRE